MFPLLFKVKFPASDDVARTLTFFPRSLRFHGRAGFTLLPLSKVWFLLPFACPLPVHRSRLYMILSPRCSPGLLFSGQVRSARREFSSIVPSGSVF